MAKDGNENKEKKCLNICQFDEMVNVILLIMFLTVVVILTVRGCRDSSEVQDKNMNQYPKLTNSVDPVDSTLADSISIVQ